MNIGTLSSDGKTLRIRINLRKLREGCSTYDAGRMLQKIGKELAEGFDFILTPECYASIDQKGRLT